MKSFSKLLKLPLTLISAFMALVMLCALILPAIPTPSVQKASAATYQLKSQEYRAVWVSHFTGDLPTYTTEATYKSNFNAILDNMESWGMNAMVFHVRTHNNALYKSSLNPVAKWWANVDFDTFDPLAWSIQACHERGIEFHAWMNPFRVKIGSTTYHTGSYPSGNPANVSSNLCEGTYTSSGITMTSIILDPGIPSNREFLVDTCMEVIENYDVDAVHFDDYFYVKNADDSATRAKYNTSGLSIGNFRRASIDSFIQQLDSEIAAYNAANDKAVELGIAPTNVYQNGKSSSYPTSPTYDANGTLTYPITTNANGAAHYDDYLYCDTKKWVDNEWIDYITPQSYHASDHSTAPFANVVQWWDWEVANKDVNLSMGVGIYFAQTNEAGWDSSDELSKQMLIANGKEHVTGLCFYDYGALVEGGGYIANHLTTLKSNWSNKIPSVVKPQYTHLPEPTVSGVTLNGTTLSWDSAGAIGTEIRGYVVWKVSNGEEVDITSVDQLYDYVQTTSLTVEAGYNYYVSTVNLANEISEPIVDPYFATVSADSLNVRSGPDSSYEIVSTLAKGDVVTIVAETNGWGQLKDDAGWISLDYVTKGNPITQTYNLTTSVNGSGGTAHFGGGTTSTVTHAYNTIYFQTTPDENYEVTSILLNGMAVPIENDGADAVYSFTMPEADVNIVVTFAPITYNVSLSVNGTGGVAHFGTVGVTSFDSLAGLTILFQATPDAGYVVSEVLVDGVAQEIQNDGGDAVYSLTMPEKDVVVEITFAEAEDTALAETKDTANTELGGYESTDYLGDYSTANATVIAGLVDAAQTQIEAATSIDEVNAIMAQLRAELDAIPTAEEEQFTALKAEYVSALEAAYPLSSYSTENQATVQTTLQTYTAQINAATSASAVATAYGAACAELDAIPTLNAEQALTQAKAQAISALQSHCDLSEYSQADQVTMQAIIQSYSTQINAATSVSQVEGLLQAACAQLDTYQSEQTTPDPLEAARESVLNAATSYAEGLGLTTENAQYASLLSALQADLNEATDVTAMAQIVNEFMLACDALTDSTTPPPPVTPENDAQDFLSAFNAIDNSTKDAQYETTVAAIILYNGLSDAEKQEVAEEYAQLVASVNAYNAEVTETNEAHASALGIVGVGV